MKVKFETDYRDFADAVWLASGAKSAYRSGLFYFILLYAILAAVSSLGVFMFAPHYIFAAVNFVIVFLLCAYFFKPPSLRHFVGQYRQVYGGEPFSYEIELADEALTVGDGTAQSVISWQRVKELSETEEHIFLIFQYHTGIKIPKTAFQEPFQIGEFIAFASSRIPSTEALNVRNNQ